MRLGRAFACYVGHEALFSRSLQFHEIAELALI